MNRYLGAVVAKHRHDLQEVPGPVRAEVEDFPRVALVSGDERMLDPVANVLVADPLLASRVIDIHVLSRLISYRETYPGEAESAATAALVPAFRGRVVGCSALTFWGTRLLSDVRRPRLDYESHAVGLDHNEVGALLVAAGLGPAIEHALISLLALNGLRVSEATGANVEALGLERGHRTLTVLRKGGKVVTIPLAPRTARAVDLAVGERLSGPIFTRADGTRLDRHGAARIVRRVAKRAGVDKRIGPHTLRYAFITAALDSGVPLRDVQEAASHADPRTTMRYDRARVSLNRHATYTVSTFIAGASR